MQHVNCSLVLATLHSATCYGSNTVARLCLHRTLLLVLSTIMSYLWLCSLSAHEFRQNDLKETNRESSWIFLPHDHFQISFDTVQYTGEARKNRFLCAISQQQLQ